MRPVLEANYWVKLNIVDVLITHYSRCTCESVASLEKSKIALIADALTVVRLILVKQILNRISDIT